VLSSEAAELRLPEAVSWEMGMVSRARPGRSVMSQARVGMTDAVE
jgi:hypothetical protein